MPSSPPPSVPTTATEEEEVSETPVAPPRRIYRNPKTIAPPPDASGSSSVSKTWMEVNRPALQGHMVSWTAWSGLNESSGVEQRMMPLVKASSAGEDGAASSRRVNNHGTARTARRPVSRLWPSFSSIGRSHSRNRKGVLPPGPSPEEHIYEEIDDSRTLATKAEATVISSSESAPPAGIASGANFSRTGRGGSFAGATRQVICQFPSVSSGAGY